MKWLEKEIDFQLLCANCHVHKDSEDETGNKGIIMREILQILKKEKSDGKSNT